MATPTVPPPDFVLAFPLAAPRPGHPGRNADGADRGAAAGGSAHLAGSAGGQWGGLTASVWAVCGRRLEDFSSWAMAVSRWRVTVSSSYAFGGRNSR